MSRFEKPRLYGLLAEFTEPERLLEAVEKARAAGYERVEAYTPYPIEEVGHALGHHRSKLPAIVLTGGVLGGTAGFLLQYWINVYAYPLNVGGRPLNSWPSFIPVTFETGILGAALAAVLGMLALNGLPRPYHPVFNAPNFAMASTDRFFLCIESGDPLFEEGETRRFLEALEANEVSDVEY